jgi:GDP-L-fucose synthase
MQYVVGRVVDGMDDDTGAFYRGQSVLVTGGTGMIGRPLVEMLLAAGAKVRIASLDDPARAPAGAAFVRADLREFGQCLDVCRGADTVFHLAGVKGSPKMAAERPASFMVPTIQFSVAMMEAARQQRVARYLFTSSVGVYAPAEVFHEDEVWKSFPSPHDRFAGWAKRVCELQAEAYRIEYGWKGISIVRPANVYGPYDNFDPANAMVIPSLIRRIADGENPLVVWGDGSAERDFIHARDVARGMMLVVAKGVTEPVNLGSGRSTTIREVVEIAAAAAPRRPEIRWDTSKPAGDRKRIMDMARATAHGFAPRTGIEEGIRSTFAWYLEHRHQADRRYNAFSEAALAPAPRLPA